MRSQPLFLQDAKRPTVVFVDHCARLSGAELALSRLVPELAKHVEVVVVLGEDGPLVTLLSAAGVRVVVLPMAEDLRERRKDSAGRLRDVAGTVAYAWQLRRLLLEVGADLVHTNSLKAAVYAGVAGRLARVPVVWHVRDRIAEDYLPRPAVKAIRALSLVLPSAVIANSVATLATLPRRRQNAVVYNAVVGCPEASTRGRRDSGPLVFGIVGRLSEWKGQHVFLDAFASAFPADQHRAHLVGAALFGESDYEGRLRSLVRDRGLDSRVVFRGFCEDVGAEYAALDVLVHCSTIPEPFGQVVLEGLAHGLPVVASSAGGPAEILTDDVDGLLTPPGNVPALSAALQRLAADAALRCRLAGAGRVTAAGFSAATSADGVLDVYDRLIRRP